MDAGNLVTSDAQVRVREVVHVSTYQLYGTYSKACQPLQRFRIDLPKHGKMQSGTQFS